MYWFSNRKNTDKSIPDFFIQCFDFSKEIFEETCCLPFVNRDDDWLLSGSRGDSLSLLSKDKYGKIQLWVTNNLTDEIASWSKYFNVTPPYLTIIFHGYFNTTFFIHKTNMIMLWCEEEDVQNKDIYIRQRLRNRWGCGRETSWDDIDGVIRLPFVVVAVFLFQVWFRFQSKRTLLRVARSFMHVVNLSCSSNSIRHTSFGGVTFIE